MGRRVPGHLSEREYPDRRQRLFHSTAGDVVPRTNDLDAQDRRGTGAVGAGAEWRLGLRYALTGEWIVQASGVEAPFQSASLGFSMATARHVFHLILTNTQGHHTDLYAPGGDLDARDGRFRLGFNISRTHAFRSSERAPPQNR